jgi:hypothetical protein
VAIDPKPSPGIVFVLGAGASSEANLPVGSELTARVAECLNITFEAGRQRTGDELIYEALKQAARGHPTGANRVEAYVHAARRIAQAMPQAMSIDNFLDVHNEDELVELCGKLSIVHTILRQEAGSSLRVQDNRRGQTLSFAEARKTYFGLLFQLLTENCKFSDLPARLSGVAFVVFNYDRCLEHYLLYAIQNYYAVNREAALAALGRLSIYHPYGAVASLPAFGPGPQIAFGGEANSSVLLQLARGIRTFTEGTDPGSSEILAIRETMRTATRIVFLGFAFHRLNINLLAPEQIAPRGTVSARMFGTSHGISASDVELISADIMNRLRISREHVVLRSDLKCAGLLGEYWRSLSMV